MADTLRLVNVFLGSPGDLADERKIAKGVVDEFNELWETELGYRVALIGWEDTVSGFSRPQSAINRELKRCELFVGMIWKRWGTPPNKSGPYTSGFEEEFRSSVDRRIKEGRPEIKLLMKDIDPELLRDPGDELKKVTAFRQELIDEKQILYETFNEKEVFERKFRRCITSYVRTLHASATSKREPSDQAPVVAGEHGSTPSSAGSHRESPLSAKGTEFLREFASTASLATEQAPIPAVDIARFRLLTTLVGGEQNDNQRLGAHDANLLYGDRNQTNFGDAEIDGLVSAGLDHFSDENIPLWHWLRKVRGGLAWLPIHSVIKSTTRKRVGALKAMELIAMPLDGPGLERQVFLNSWFGPDVQSAIRLSALAYLGKCGLESDISTIRKEYEKNDNDTVGAATASILQLSLRNNRLSALRALNELQTPSVHKETLDAIFSESSSLEISVLLSCTEHRCSEVRRAATSVLRSRGALALEIANRLLNDDEPAVRYEAIKSLEIHGRKFSENEAKTILVRQVSKGAFGLLGYGVKQGEDIWEFYREETLRSLSNQELQRTGKNDGLYSRDADILYAERHFSGLGPKLRVAIDDEYRSEFALALDKLKALHPGTDELSAKYQSLEEFLRKNFTRRALDAICRKADPEDLDRVRGALERRFVESSAEDLLYLGKCGEWSDISLIVETINRGSRLGFTLTLLSKDQSRLRIAARAIVSLTGVRVAELLELNIPGSLLVHVIQMLPSNAFRPLSDTAIWRLFRSEDDSVRKYAVLKCIYTMPKTRIRKLMIGYVSGIETHYYNVVHWLDFGLSVERNLVKKAAQDAFARAQA